MQKPDSATRRIAFVLTPRFSMIAFANAIEVLRLANRHLERPAYVWRIISADEKLVSASNGIGITTDGSLDDIPCSPLMQERPEMIVVCAGVRVENYDNPRLFAWLRCMHSRGVLIGGLCTGAWILARAGLLEGRRCAIHWENLPGFAENFPDVDVRADLFEIDGPMHTCAGGTAALDMFLHLIAEHHGPEVMTRVCEMTMTDHVREASHRQRVALCARPGMRDSRLLRIISLMEANLAEPRTLAELSAMSGLSRRHIERLFRQHVGRSPARYYLDLRLEQARQLLMQSDMAVVDVAVACGFVSGSHFSRCYRARYGRSPVEDRRRHSLLAEV